MVENFMEGATLVFDLLIHFIRKIAILHDHFVIQQMMLHSTFRRKKQMTKNPTDISDLPTKGFTGQLWHMISHFISICIFRMPE